MELPFLIVAPVRPADVTSIGGLLSGQWLGMGSHEAATCARKSWGSGFVFVGVGQSQSAAQKVARLFSGVSVFPVCIFP